MRRLRANWVRSSVAWVTVAALVCSLTVVVFRADGVVGSNAALNDGGAWLVNRARGAVGHVNQASAEVTSRVSVGVAGSALDIAQAEGVIAVHDASLRKLLLVDDRLGTTDGGAVLPVGSTVEAFNDGVIVWTANPLALWSLRGDALDDMTGRNIAGLEPDIAGAGPGAAVASRSGVVVAVDSVVDTMIVLDARGTPTVIDSIGLEADGRFDLTMVGDEPVLVDGTRIGRLVDQRVVWEPLIGGAAGQVTLQEPGDSATEVVGVDSEGALVRIHVESGEVESLVSAAGTGALRPIVADGCVHAGFTAPARYVRSCGDSDENRDIALDGYSASLRLRYVNGWVWVNDVATGLALVGGSRGEPQTVGDWVSAFEDEELLEAAIGGGDELVGGAPTAPERTNADASGSELGSDDEFDGDDDNVAPFARDDVAITRVGRPVVVPVLMNDEDPDGDVLLVSAATGTGTDAGVVVTPDGSGVQLTPAGGFRGVIEATYTVTDGRGGEDTATIEVNVADADASTNLPPVVVDDLVAARPATPSTINVLDNDFDPEGDTLVLLSVTGEGAAFAFTLDGRLTVTPDTSNVGTEFELQYTVADEFGATSTGTVLLNVQPEGVNNRPDARNDSAIVALGGRVILNVLSNDSDPDGDTLVVAVRPALVSGDSAAATSLRVTPDGELFFVPTVAGTYVWTYAATDGQASDVAQIRIDVRAAGDNRPPIAIRDDVAIPRGGSRIVPVLANDGDPDGDVLGIVGNLVDPASGLSVELIPDVGFRVSVGSEAPSRPQFVYQVSDGLSAPVSAVVVVAVVDGVGADQPPVLRPDVVDVRAGATVQARLLLNDFDPEGETLRIVRVSSRPDATLTVNPDGATVQISVPATTRQSFTFVYDATDVAGNQSASTVRVRVLRADRENRPPIARPDTVSVRADGSAEIDVLANDSDPDGDAVRVDGIARQPDHGTATLSAQTGAVVYTPNLDFRGTDTFEYLLVDTPGGSQIGEVRIGVMPAPAQNQPPQAVDDIGFEAVAGGAGVQIPVTNNDSDPEGDVLSVVEVSAPQVGSSRLSSRLGSVVYVPPPPGLGFSETRFTYTITDGAGNTASAIVQVSIVEAPDEQDDPVPPEAVDDVIGPVREGDDVLVPVLDNDRDPDGSVTDLRVSTRGAGEVIGSRIRFVAPASTSEYSYTITDPDGLTDSATITVLVTPNSSPVTVPIEVSTDFETPIIVDLGPGATDPDGDEVEFSCCESVQRGRTDVLSAGLGGARVEFRPDDGFSGTASFAYQVDDREGHQVTGLVQITVRSLVNQPPVADDATVVLEAGRLQPFDLTNFASDPDPDDVLVFTVGPTGGDVSVFGTSAELTLLAPINAGEADDDQFGYTVTDRNGAVASGTVFIDVVPTTIPAPVAAPDTASALAGVPVEIPVVQNDSGQGLVVVAVADAIGGLVDISGVGSVTFTPDAGREGAPASFTYRVLDVADRTASATVTVTVTDVPAQPSPPIATMEGSQTCSVTWATPANHGGVISGYVLEGDDGRIVDVGLTNAVVLDDLVNGVSYRFRVTAANVAGSSPVSDWSSACTPDIVPGRPSVPSVAFGTGALTATWNPPAVSQGSAILRYDLELGGAANATTTIAAPGGSDAVSYEWNGLTNGAAYQFRVRAENSLGFGGWSDWSATVIPCAAPGAPAAPTVARGDESFSVAWSAPSDNGGCAPVEYQVERDPGAAILSTSATSLVVSGLDTGSTYRFRVSARNTAGWGGWSTWSSDLAFCGTPGSPTTPVFQYDRFAATGYSSGSLDLTWGPAATSGGCPTLSYDVQIAATGQIRSTSVLPSDAAPFRYTGLTNGTQYAFQVRAVNAIGAGPWSALSAQETPFGPPVCSSGLISAVNQAVGQVQVTSSFTCNSNGSPDGLWYRVSTNGGPLAAFTSGDVFTGLAAGTLYQFEVSVFNSSWVPTGTSLGTGQVVTWGPPNQVSGLSCSAGNTTGACAWTQPGANGSAITGYDIELSPGSTITGHPSTSVSFSGLANGVAHSARVRACNSVGCGAWSTSATFTPVQPLSVSISRGGNAEGVGGCATPACSFITVTLGGPWVAPFTMVCFVAGGATAADILFSGSTSAPSDLCVTDRGAEGVTVTLDGITSNTIFW